MDPDLPPEVDEHSFLTPVIFLSEEPFSPLLQLNGFAVSQYDDSIFTPRYEMVV
jgi:hypothetical protein